MCSSAMSNAPDGAAYIAQLVSAQHCTSIPPQPQLPIQQDGTSSAGRCRHRGHEAEEGIWRVCVPCLPAGHTVEVRKAREVVGAGRPSFGSACKGPSGMQRGMQPEVCPSTLSSSPQPSFLVT